jgi:hypothetical protein
MPTARELLEQADALMRRNRKPGKTRFGDVPTLAQMPGAEHEGTLAPTIVLPEGAGSDATPIALDVPRDAAAGVEDDPISLDTLADVPVLTDVVVQGSTIAAAFGFVGEELPDGIAAGAPVSRDAGDAFPASAADAAAAAARLAPPTVLEQEGGANLPPAEPASVPPAPPRASGEDEFILEIPPEPEAPQAAAIESPIPPIAPPPALAAGGGEWDALAEEIRMQVLQRLDLFTDTGLRDQLGAHLRPIVERASAQLVETINRELGDLVRGYVAEAIEREIESWRKRES